MKMVNSSVARAVRFALFSSASLFALGIGAVQAEEEASDSAEEEESIVITGSRIRREGYETPAPTMVIDAEQIKNTGAVSLGEALNELPQLRSTFSLSNSGRFIGTAGAGFQDLRGLGAERTLVLINGRRHVAASDGTAQVDVNSIPANMIDKVEILTGANSAVYGADAVSGVVNITLKSDYEGTKIDVDYGKAEDSGFNKKSMSILKGFNFAEDKGNAIFSLSYSQQDRLTASERGGFFTEGWGLVNNPANGDTVVDGVEIDDGIPDDIYVPNTGRWFISTGGVNTGLRAYIQPDGSLVYYDQLDDVVIDGSNCYGSDCNPLDLTTFTDLQVGFERFGMEANFTYDITDNHTWFWESRFSEVEGLQSGQPTFDAFSTPVIINRDNAYASADLIAAMNDGGVDVLNFNRFNIDAGRRFEDNTRQTFRIVTGLEGYITDYWEYSTFINWGKTEVERVNRNNRINDRWMAAYDAVRLTAADLAAINGPNGDADLLRGATVGQIVCRSRLQAASGLNPTLVNGDPASRSTFENCVPANVVGAGNISQEAINYFNSTALGFATVEQTQVQAVISNQELVELPAGPLGFVFGTEYRQEVSSSKEDSLSSLDATFFNALSATNGRFDVTEFFTETAIPLVADVPFMESLDLELAARYSDYSTIGDTVTWESRLNWTVNSQFRIRATHGEALRAPNIGDLFSPAGESFSAYDDPCDFENLAGGSGLATRIRNCQALGIADPENFNATDEASVRLLSSGNAELKEETATSTTFGFVYSPSFLPNFNISIDYWEVTIEEAIASTDIQSILNRCVDATTIDNEFCSLITRGGDGNVLLVEEFPLNLNVLESSGYEFEMDYRVDMGAAGSLRPRLTGSYLEDRTFTLNTSNGVDIVDGELGDPKLEMRLGLNWELENIGAFLEVRYLDKQYTVEQETLFGLGNNTDPNPDIEEITEVGAEYIVDIGANYTFANGLKAGFLIDNALDNDPPFPFTGTGAGSGIYPNYGRFFSVNASWEF